MSVKDGRKEKGFGSNDLQRVALIGKASRLDDVTLSCDAICEPSCADQSLSVPRRRHHSEKPRWLLFRMSTKSSEAPRKGSYQDLRNAGCPSKEETVGVYRATTIPARGQSASLPAGKDRAWFRRRKNGMDLGRLSMPLNAGTPDMSSSGGSSQVRTRHPSDHSVSQPVPVACGGKQRHRSCVTGTSSPHSPFSPQSSPFAGGDVASVSSCASSVTESKSRKSSGSSTSNGSAGGTGARIRSFIDNFRPRAKSEHVPPCPSQLEGANTLCVSSQSVDHCPLESIPQGQELGPSSVPSRAGVAVKRPRSPSFGTTFVERLRNLSASSSGIGQGPVKAQSPSGPHKSLTKLPDPAKLPKALGSGSLVFTKMPLSPNRGGRTRKGFSLDLEISYPPVNVDPDFEVDVNELRKELRISLPSSCPSPGPGFNNNNTLLKNNLWESMDTSNAEVFTPRSRTASSSTPPLVKDGMQVQESSKYIIFRDKTETTVESSHVQWESMSNIEDAYVQFMRRHTCYDLIPTSSKLVVFDTALIVRRAFFGLVYNGVRAAPLWDSKRQQFVGMLTITDFIRILRHYYRSSSIPIEELENQRIQQWRETIHDDRDRPLIQVSPEDTLFNAVHQLVVHQVHRLPIIDPQTGNALHILTHKRILKYLSLYMKDIPQPAYMNKGIVDLGIGTFKDVATVTADTPLLKVLNMFIDHRVSALPVVDEDNKLIDIYAKFDVINLAARQTYNNLEISVKEALSYRKDRFEGVATCKCTDTLDDVVKKIVQAGVHRLVMVDDENHVTGVVSLSDLLKYMVIGKANKSGGAKPGCVNCPEEMETESAPKTT